MDRSQVQSTTWKGGQDNICILQGVHSQCTSALKSAVSSKKLDSYVRMTLVDALSLIRSAFQDNGYQDTAPQILWNRMQHQCYEWQPQCLPANSNDVTEMLETSSRSANKLT